MRANKILILGIETSCDETAAAVVQNGRKVLSNIVASQTDWHRHFGGVVPEIAARHHLELINTVVDEALAVAESVFPEIDAIAVTRGPGLVGALLVGMATAKAYSLALDVPLIGINHLEGHIYAALLDNPKLTYPFMALIISGGHTSLVLVREPGTFLTIGRTVDDAAGEAFDKIAKFLNLGYPGGPIIDRLARQGDAAKFNFPRAMIDSGDYNFSLSGLKTAVINAVSKLRRDGQDFQIEDVCAAFQRAVIDVQVAKTIKAAIEFECKNIVLTGGVAANTELREYLDSAARRRGLLVFSPTIEMCTDNAAMVAAAAYDHFQMKDFLSLGADVDANLSI